MTDTNANHTVNDKPAPSPVIPISRSPDITTRLLDFLSTASNEQLGACAVGLGAATYFVLGRVGLILIGAVGGIVLHATWEGNNQKDAASIQMERTRRKEAGIDVVKRLLSWQDTRSVEDKDVVLSESGHIQPDFNFDTFQPETAAALRFIVDRVIDDYVKWWYSPILPVEQSFPASCRRIFTSFLLSFSSHLSRKRPEDVFLNFLTNSTSIFIVFLGELSRALMAQAAAGQEPADAIALYLTDHPDSSFSSVLDRAEQAKKLKAVSDDILHTFLESDAYACEPVKTFLTQVLAGLIFEPTLVNCSKAEWINGWIVYLLEEGEPEIMNAINAGVGEATSKTLNTAPPAEKVSSGTKETEQPVFSEDDEDREALEEVKRLNALIASEEAGQANSGNGNAELSEDLSASRLTDVPSLAPSTDNLLTPTSSQSGSGESRTRALSDAHSEIEYAPAAVEPSQTQQTLSPTFDQIVPQNNLFVEPAPLQPLTLHKAAVNIFDDAQPGEKATIKSKPMVEYLLQIEPASSQHPGWMIARKYADFETLHEVLRRISVISGVPEFNNRFAAVPAWKGQTKNTLRADLEIYLREALSHARLAESEGMKRFLEKDQGLEKMGDKKGVLGFPTPEAFQTMGKGMLDALASAPKGAAGGGKALLDGMKGVGGVFTAQKRSTSRSRQNNRGMSTATLPRMSEDQSSRTETISEPQKVADDTDASLRSSRTSVESVQPNLTTRDSSVPKDGNPWASSSAANGSRMSFQQESSLLTESIPEHAAPAEEVLNLPPRPDEIDTDPAIPSLSRTQSLKAPSIHNPPPVEAHKSESIITLPMDSPPKPPKKKDLPFTTDETTVAIELIFATINELYTLSSAWQIRKTLLNAAKTFLLRPGSNPTLDQIKSLLQEKVITANVSDSGLAYHLLKLRENSLPTEEEFKLWPAPLTEEEKERLRVKARRLFVEEGIPPALKGIMGAAASREALGRLFDSLQVQEVARGLMFAVLVQCVRAVTH